MERKYRLFKEISEADEKYIEEMRSESVAEKIRKKNLIKYGSAAKRRRAVISALAAAAVLAVVCTAVIPQMKETENAVSTADVDVEMQAKNETQTADAEVQTQDEATDEETAEEAAESTAESEVQAQDDVADDDTAETEGITDEAENIILETENENNPTVAGLIIYGYDSGNDSLPPYNTLKVSDVAYAYDYEVTEESAGEYLGGGDVETDGSYYADVYNADGYDEGEAIIAVFEANDSSDSEAHWYLYVKSE